MERRVLQVSNQPNQSNSTLTIYSPEVLKPHQYFSIEPENKFIKAERYVVASSGHQNELKILSDRNKSLEDQIMNLK